MFQAALAHRHGGQQLYITAIQYVRLLLVQDARQFCGGEYVERNGLSLTVKCKHKYMKLYRSFNTLRTGDADLRF